MSGPVVAEEIAAAARGIERVAVAVQLHVHEFDLDGHAWRERVHDTASHLGSGFRAGCGPLGKLRHLPRWRGVDHSAASGSAVAAVGEPTRGWLRGAPRQERRHRRSDGVRRHTASRGGKCVADIRRGNCDDATSGSTSLHAVAGEIIEKHSSRQNPCATIEIPLLPSLARRHCRSEYPTCKQRLWKGAQLLVNQRRVLSAQQKKRPPLRAAKRGEAGGMGMIAVSVPSVPALLSKARPRY